MSKMTGNVGETRPRRRRPIQDCHGVGDLPDLPEIQPQEIEDYAREHVCASYKELGRKFDMRWEDVALLLEAAGIRRI